jgi:hypothetical protein
VHARTNPTFQKLAEPDHEPCELELAIEPRKQKKIFCAREPASEPALKKNQKFKLLLKVKKILSRKLKASNDDETAK